MLTLFAWKSSLQLIVPSALEKDFASDVAKRDTAQMNANLPRHLGNPREITTPNKSETLKSLPSPCLPLPASLLSPPLMPLSRTSPPRAKSLKTSSKPWKSAMRMMEKTWPQPPPSQTMRILIWEVALTSSSHDLSHVLVVLPNEWTIHLPIKLATGTQIVETTTLIDCGATRNFIDISLLSKANFPLQHLPKPIQAYNVDGTANIKGTIRWKAHTDILFSQYRENIDLMVLSLGRQQVILGMPWLHKWNPRIDWLSNTISTPRSPASPSSDYIPQWYLLCWLGLDADQKISHRLDKQQAWLKGEQINKTTISPQIAQATPSTEPVIPEWCNDFTDIFSEKTHDQLPPHRPYDHTIELCPDFTPKIAKVCSLNPTEMEMCKSFVKEHLKRGQIVPLKSPQASPFFFIPKKDETLCPCQDYHYLNSHTVWNTYHFP